MQRVVLACDIDKAEDESVETHEFSFDGRGFRAEMCKDCVQNAPMRVMVEVGRPIKELTLRKPAKPATTVVDLPQGQETIDRAKVREWAKANGQTVHTNGRIPKNVILKYIAAHSI